MKTLVILCIILQLALTETQVILSVTSNSTFPHFIGKSFSIQIQPLANDSNLSADPSDTMVIRIVDLNFTEIQKELFIYGVQDSLDEEIQGTLMNIKIWEKNSQSTEMNISIIFKRGAHKKYLEIFYFSAPNKYQRRKYLKNLSLAKRLYHELIDLFIPSTLAISVIPINVERKEIIFNDMVMASCRAFGGIPPNKPRFKDHTHLNVTTRNYSEKANEIKTNFRASLSDHLTNISCTAGNVTETFTIHIHHHPSKVRIKPDINEILQANRTIQCYALDGYPQPSVRVQLIEGPSNASQYYETRANGSQIYINSKAPTKSVWKFKCSIKSTIANVTETLTKDVAFTVASHPTSISIKPMPKRIMEPNSTITCASADGYPVPAGQWEIVKGPENSSLYYNIVSNGTQIQLNANCPTKSEWKIKCVAKSCMENACEILNKTISFRIANHPTALYIQPIIKNRIRSNSTIKCYTKDGYPDPDINWQLIEGPPNADRFYNIPGKGDRIHINSNSPIGSKWTFKCIMKSILVNTKKMLNKTISFAIAKNPMENCGEKCLTSKISDIEESVEENGRLQEDIRLVFDQVKEQMRLMGEKQQETSRRLNSSIEQGKEQMRLMGEKQQETSRRLNSNIEQMKEQMRLMGEKQQETSRRLHSSIGHVINKLAMKGFSHTFKLSPYTNYQSPPFPSISPLFVMWNSIAIGSLNNKWGFSPTLRFTNPERIQANIDMKYECSIIRLEPHFAMAYVIRSSVTFDTKYRGTSDMDYAPVDEKYYRYYPPFRLNITCNLLSYKYLP